MTKTRILIASILLERNRWAEGKTPTYRVSEWMSRWAEAGFDGIELWENHAFRVDEIELKAIESESQALPVAVFSSYASLDKSGADSRLRAAEICERLRIPAIKFNFGGQPEKREQYLDSIRAWQQLLPKGARMLCECHAGTIAENPSEAASLLAALGSESIGVIVHPFVSPLTTLQDMFAVFNQRVRHAHVQMRTSSVALALLEQNSEYADCALRIMKEHKFSGTYALEFTAGTGAEDENVEMLNAAAERDLAFLRRSLQE